MKPWVIFDADTHAAFNTSATEGGARMAARAAAIAKPSRRVSYVDASVPEDVVLQSMLGDPYLIYAKPCDTFCS